MIPVDQLIAFLVTTAMFAYMPGPAMLYTAAQTLSRGRRAGLLAALGIHVGGYVHVIAAAAGLSVLFHAVPPLYTAVKIAGALYLIWLGIGLIRGASDATPAVVTRPAKPGRRAFLDSIAVEVLNPKAAMFFLAFLPQFVEPSGALPIWVQFAVLGTVVNVMFSSADVLCVALAGTLMERLRRSGRARMWAQRTGGVLLVGLGARLALQRE